MEQETWKTINGYNGIYQVSTLGRVKSFHKGKEGHLLQPISVNGGYLRVTLRWNKQGYYHYIHRLVAEAFLPNPDNLPEVNHINENKSDNNVSNLEWCSSKYNLKYGSRMRRFSKSKSRPVNQYSLDGQFLNTSPSIKEASESTHVSKGNIDSCCKGRRKNAGGFIWKPC